MLRGNAAKRLAERFKPGIFERLQQSKEAKESYRNNKPKVLKAPVQELMPIHTGGMASPTIGSGGTWGSIWMGWNTQYTISTQTITSANPWTVWVGTNSAATTAGSTVWSVWNQPVQMYQDNLTRVPETAEQRRVRQEQEVRYQAEQAERNALYLAEERERNIRWEAERQAVEVARQTAKELLMSLLTPEQRDMLLKRQFFLVKAKSGRVYRIDEGTHGNLKVLDKDMKVIERLCIQPNGVPAGDAMLMQKLMIETAEDVFRSHANITLADGRTIMGDARPLDGHKLAEVIPLRRAA